MSGFRGLIGGIAGSASEMLGAGIKRDAEIEDEKRRNEAAMMREQSMARFRVQLENEQRTAQTSRIDAAAGAIADQAAGKTRAEVGSGIADKGNWTPEQQAAVDQSISADRQALIGDPMTRFKAGVTTGDVSLKEAASVELGERRADREEKKGDQRYEIEKEGKAIDSKRLDQQIKHQDATLAETIKHNRALEANSANRADKLSPAAKAQLEIAQNKVQSAHKEESIAARALDSAMKSTEFDPEKKKADIAAARAEFAAAKNAVATANTNYDKVGAAHLGAEWKTIAQEEKPQDATVKPKPPAAALAYLEKNPKARADFVAKYGEDSLPPESAKPAAKVEEPKAANRPLIGGGVEEKFNAENREMNDMKRTSYSPEVQAYVDKRKAEKAEQDKKNSDQFKADELRRSLNKTR